MDSRIVEVAVRAAREAGALLRSAFHEPPRSGDAADKAEIDAEAERAIRRILDEAFPEDGVQGEELPAQNRLPSGASRRVWYIDPQDGTASFYRGWRGPAVSIGLVESGRPILGVVFAYAAPDDRGDLFVWAEGMPSILRNKRPVMGSRGSSRLSRTDSVLVPPWAERRPRDWTEILYPARFRVVPSLAYQLALVAAREASALVSPGSARDFDCAGGHALLRAAGGYLADGAGRPLRYVTGETVTYRHVLGGAPAAVTELSQRDWESVIGKPPESEPGDLDPLLPVRGSAIADAGLLSRAQGAWIGQISGDALGSLVEFQRPEEIARRHPGGVRVLVDGGVWSTLAGQPTDDSELALMLARSLVRKEAFDAERILRAYVHWFESQPFDIGDTTQAALSAAASALREGTVDPIAAAARSARADSQSNGALMRVSPLGIFGHAADPEALAAWACEDATLTHPHPVCKDASAVYAVVLARAIRSGEEPRELYRFALEWSRASGVHESVREAIARAGSGPPADFTHRQGWVLTALQNAFWQLLDAPSFEAGVVDTVRRGGDTDTNGAIAGALLGAVHGISAVPFQWLDRVLTCRPIHGAPGVETPRPREFWPVDALVLAERLLIAGTRAPLGQGNSVVP